jgi:mannose-6-phosphate isomerase
MQPFRLIPEYRERVWGGHRLQPGPRPIGEAWIVYEQNKVADGPNAGRTLGALAAAEGEPLLGRRAMRTTGLRFPLLIKLLDCTDWLSVQVHPNDAQAERLEGPGNVGKTEAWHILEAEPGAQLISGLRPGVTAETVAQALKTNTILDVVEYLPVKPGDTLFTPAGMLHALGPGLLLYEVQQTSDLTYRVFDWNRPQAAGRELHIDKSLAVTDPTATGRAKPLPSETQGIYELTACRYFVLEALNVATQPMALDTQGESFHALTVVQGEVAVQADGWRETLGRFETLLVPAACGLYRLEPMGQGRVLRSSVGV